MDLREEKIEQAVKAITEDKRTVQIAVGTCGISKSTLFDRLKKER